MYLAIVAGIMLLITSIIGIAGIILSVLARTVAKKDESPPQPSPQQ
jgi:hypothetical protein